MTKLYFGTAQVARFLGVHPDTLRQYVKSGQISCATTPPGPHGRSHRRYAVQDVVDFMTKHTYSTEAINIARVAAGLHPERPPEVGDVVQLQLSVSRNCAGTGLLQLILVAGSDIEERQLLDLHRRLRRLIETQDVQAINALFRGDTHRE